MAKTERFYRLVPKGFAANLQYRLALRQAALCSQEVRAAVMAACKNDFLYWLNTFGWLYEPRPRELNGIELPPLIPFITWPHQDREIRKILPALGKRDIGMEKSRGEGASWIAMALAVHDFVFLRLAKVGVVSRNLDSVDNPDNPDSLLWKVQFLLDKLPPWMRPDYDRLRSTRAFLNRKTQSTITGYTSTGDVASGGRNRWMLMDELAKFPRGEEEAAMKSTQHVTDCRFIVSTYKGTDGVFYDLMHKETAMLKCVLHWSDNPTRNRGLYRLVDGVPVAVDPEKNPLLPEYDPPSQAMVDRWSRLRKNGFRLEGRDRSAWYDNECDRASATPQAVAEELDMDASGTMARAFGTEFFIEAERSALKPFSVGHLNYNPENHDASWSSSSGGQWSLWCNLSAGRPPRSRYVVGCDPCTGLGGTHTANSVLEVFDVLSGEQVAEYVSNTILPSDLTDLAVACCKWFWDAYFIWEVNGPGGSISRRLQDIGYGNIHRREVLTQGTGGRKTRELGWWSNSKTKEVVFGELDRKVRRGRMRLRSPTLVRECGQYIREGDKLIHSSARRGNNPTERGEAHGDRVIAAMLCAHQIKGSEKKQHVQDAKLDVVEARLREVESVVDVWDDRSVSDLISHITS